MTVSGLLAMLLILGCATRDEDVPTEAHVNRWIPAGTHVWEALFGIFRGL